MDSCTRVITLNTHKLAQRMEVALGEEEEMYINGCPLSIDVAPDYFNERLRE